MRSLLSIVLTTFSFISFAEQNAKVHYFENVPSNKHRLTFKTNKSCKTDSDFIHIRDFYSEKKYASVYSGKEEPVRVLHIHVNSNLSTCKEAVSLPVEKTFDIPKAKMMTHIYVISDPSIEVSSIQ